MKSIIQNQSDVVQEFARFSTWEERYQHLIAMGKALPPFPEEYRIEANKVKGCQSQVWLQAALSGDKVIYHIDSDALIVKGLAALLLQVYSGHTPDEIMAAGSDFLAQIGLTTHLSQSRANGLGAMVRQFKNYAVAFSVVLKSKARS